MRRIVAASIAAAVTTLLAIPQATAATQVMPGRFTGYAFDACQAPPQETMDAWRESSPYWGIGIYIAGDNRFCDVQRELDATWVATQAKRGWRLLPLTVGRQASCFHPERKDVTRIDPDPTYEYTAAVAQGRSEAMTTVQASQALGLAKGTTQWLDIEAFDLGNDHCRRSMLAFVSGWTAKLHALGYKSGYYSSGSSGITALEGARVNAPGVYNLPDKLWVGDWNGRATVGSSYVAPTAWASQRVHQYRGGHNETYGGATVNIDSNWMEVGGGSRAPKPSPHCGVRVDFPSYGSLRRGSRGPKVTALQCFLRQKHVYGGRLHGRYDRATARAVTRFQHRNPPLAETGRATKGTWTALLSQGKSPFVKVGSASNAVRRLQRALNAATTSRLEITGVYDKPTAKAVKTYQRSRALPRTGVTTDAVWTLLFDGRR